MPGELLGRVTRERAPSVTTEVITQPQTGNGLKRAAKRLRRKPASTSQSGAALFPHLVWAHYQWERRLHVDGRSRRRARGGYKKSLHEFQGEQGTLEQVYWSHEDSLRGWDDGQARPPATSEPRCTCASATTRCTFTA